MTAFLLELFSLLSRTLNVLSGGTADMTLSARAYRDGLWIEGLIDTVARVVFSEADHCRVWWEAEVERSLTVVNWHID